MMLMIYASIWFKEVIFKDMTTSFQTIVKE